VLDEADEMLRMGFIDDVEWVLEQTPSEKQIALFSATMPTQIRRIATKYLNEPEQVTIKLKTATAETIRQRFWPVSGLHKLDALTRILEAEHFDAMLIFVRTKTATVELAEKLEARGYATGALNGDIPQNLRERTVDNLKKSKLDILVATDVAARGLDVSRITHVVNYDIPYDTETYIHRIGRTGRAGREGDAILFVAPREKRLLHAIERATNKKVERMELPSTELINDKRIEKFKQRITDTLASEELTMFYQLIEQYQQEHNVPALEIAAALAHQSQGDTPFLLQNKPQRQSNKGWDKDDSPRNKKPNRRDRERDRERDRSSRKDTPFKQHKSEEGMESFRLEVGHNDDVKPGNIVGAIANEAGLDSQHIGRIRIHDDYSLVDLPEGMPNDVLNDLKKAWVSGKQLQISRLGEDKKPKGGKLSLKKSDDRKPRDAKSGEVKSRGKKPTEKKSSGKKSSAKKPKGKKSKSAAKRTKPKSKKHTKDIGKPKKRAK
jgi:ATP-dependent RNA helicase DeaD